MAAQKFGKDQYFGKGRNIWQIVVEGRNIWQRSDIWQIIVEGQNIGQTDGWTVTKKLDGRTDGWTVTKKLGRPPTAHRTADRDVQSGVLAVS